jgi:hypothetical protein
MFTTADTGSNDTTTAFFFSSGCFVHQPDPWKIGGFTLSPPATHLYNLATEPTDNVVTLPNVAYKNVVAQVSDVVGERVKPDNIRKLTAADIESYHGNLESIAVELKTFCPALVLVPLRGGLKPRQIVDGLLNHVIPFEEFGFTHKSDKTLAQQYADELRGVLARYSAKQRDLRVGVLDAGIGGDSCNILKKLLVRIHQELGGLWRVQFHILHEHGRTTAPFNAMPRKPHPGLKFSVRLHEVSSLIVEDWNPGIGLETVRNGERLTYKESIQPGAVFITRHDGTCFLFASEDARKAVNKVISVLGTERMHQTLKRHTVGDHLADYAKRFK